MTLELAPLAKGSMPRATLPLAVEARMVLFNPFQVLAFAMVLQILVVLAHVAANGVTTLAVGD
jgi:hypothetical protein